MKRGLVFSLCAIAMAATATSAMAQANINVSLNLRYTDPADPTEGGTWNLVAKTNDVDGIAALVVYLSNAGTPGTTTLGPNIGAMTMVGENLDQLPILTREGGKLEIVYAQDMQFATTVKRVGQGDGTGPNAAAPGEIAVDPLRNPAWNGASLIASGSFGATRPMFTTVLGGDPEEPRLSDGNTLPATINGMTDADAANVTTIVRGDSLETLGFEGAGKGLQGGDANRDGIVNGSDFAILSGSWQTTNKTWDQGNFNDDVGGAGIVNGSDFAILSGNWQSSQLPVSVGAVPEPSSIAIAMLASLASIGMFRRRIS